jgi:protocatechuate 3,4-dioxygenase beta subunit
MKVTMFGCSLPRALVAVLLASYAIDKVFTLEDSTTPTINDAIAATQYNYTPDRRHLQDNDETIVLFFHGTLLNDLWEPVNGAQVQFWQTDKFGVYNHPDDLSSRGNPPLQSNFQYFGTATSDTDGKFDFITYRPGIYPSRPITHIHYKVFLEGQELLTSQFYFADEGNSQFSHMIVLDLVPVEPQFSDDPTATEYFRSRNSTHSVTAKYFQTFKTIVVDLNLGGAFQTTPRQTEGPFYPIVDFFDVGYDLTRPDQTPPTNSPTGSSDTSTIVPSDGTSNGTSPDTATDNNISSSANNSGTSPDTAADNEISSSSTSAAAILSFNCILWMLMCTVLPAGFGLLSLASVLL